MTWFVEGGLRWLTRHSAVVEYLDAALGGDWSWDRSWYCREVEDVVQTQELIRGAERVLKKRSRLEGTPEEEVLEDRSGRKKEKPDINRASSQERSTGFEVCLTGMVDRGWILLIHLEYQIYCASSLLSSFWSCRQHLHCWKFELDFEHYYRSPFYTSATCIHKLHICISPQPARKRNIIWQ